MPDYLQEASPLGRRIGGVLSAAAALLSWAVLAIVIAGATRGHSIRGGGITLVVTVVLFGSIALYTSCMFVQLARGRKSANRITVVPAWMIQAFGVFFLLGLSWVAYSRKAPLLLLEAGVVAFAMVLVGRHIKARQRRMAEASTPDGSVPPSHG